MALGVDAVVVRTSFEDFTVRVQRGGPRPVGEQLELARWAASQFRFGIDTGDPGVVRAARELLQLLDGDGLGFGRGAGLLDDGFGFGSRSSPFDAREPLPAAFGGIAGRLEEELLAGRLLVARERFASLTERRDLFEPELPPLPPARRESTTRTFEVRFVDEVGKAISGIDAEFTADGAQTRATNAAGIALLEGVQSSSANVAILDPDALAKVLDPRWENFRAGAPPKESNTQEVIFRGEELGPFALKAEVPNTVVVKPPLGKLFVELWDEAGRVPHAKRGFSISGPQSFSGTTDADGRLLQLGVFPGDYELTLTLDFFKGDPDAISEEVSAPLLVLAPPVSEPQLRLIGPVPRSILARLRMFFNTNKAFILPSALPSIKKLRALYAENAPCKLLVVGHADTRGSVDKNDKLSLRRANATVAYLKDDVEAWLDFYSDADVGQRWGKTEDHLMIISMPDFVTKPKGENEVEWFQRTRGLTIDGDARKETRTALVGEYMALDGVSLQELVGDVDAVAHGCGENFPLTDDGERVDDAPEDQKRDPGDRRAELFFFDAAFGITPKPPGDNSPPGSPQYPKWRERVAAIEELRGDDGEGPRVTFIELEDARFRTDSAVVLPEGEDPDQSGEHQALTSVSLFAAALRFNDEHSGKTLLVAGHTDSAADVAHNQKLSEARAEVALCLLKGGSDSRQRFGDLCHERHTVSDYKQFLSWVARAFADLGFACAPTKIDDNGGTDDEAVRNFQRSYNANKRTLNADLQAPDLVIDGSVGPATWRAFFDCCELALKRELGEDAVGVAKLRDKLRFEDKTHESLGFSEHFPIEELGVDNFRSQANRRVEILFFDAGEGPDLDHAADDPETSELYLPGQFQTIALKATPTARRPNTFEVHVRDAAGVVSTVTITTDFGFEKSLTTEQAVPDDDENLSVLRFEKLPDLGLFSVRYRDGDGIESTILVDLPFAALGGTSGPANAAPGPEPIATSSTEDDDFNPEAYLDLYSA